MFVIYKKVEENGEVFIKQQFINEGDEIPEGWTLEKPDIDEKPFEIELIENELTNTQLALTEVFEMLEELL